MDNPEFFHSDNSPERFGCLPVRLWICGHSGNFHLGIGREMYTFSPNQFRDFARQVNVCALDYGMTDAGFTETVREICALSRETERRN